MSGEKMVFCGLFIIVMTIILACIFGIYGSESASNQYRLECIKAGKSYIQGSCIKVAP